MLGSSPSQSLPLSLESVFSIMIRLPCHSLFSAHHAATSGWHHLPSSYQHLVFCFAILMVLPEQLENTTLNPLFSSFQTPSLLFTRDYQSPLLRHVRQSLRVLASSVSPHLSLAFLFVKIQSDLPGPEQMPLPPGSLPPPLAIPEAVSLAFRGRCWQFALL